MRQGIYTLESFKKRCKPISICEYQGKEYILYKDEDTMILVNTTDGWYVYLFECVLNNMELIDKNSFLKLRG